ncbi:L-serine dehydratase alpha subunit [Ligilactobacillus salitolerans]|uniref:L-serine dehydratase n=1 Tax=Ligilactobacillus salitolerans TaxID=1808352 RepID=A0A401IV27_9LACO|nr:L-serine ammonia-lyase, iron-sulfur-dependent, subunit alpha [Ligilactobacillus salitolerans]GBG95403.1 L-serine dehydratase alpha subunit [Ligilactobacillus salitolerans]
MFKKISEMVKAAEDKQQTIARLILEEECAYSGASEEEVTERMHSQLETMKKAARKGMTGQGVTSQTQLTGGDAVKLSRYHAQGDTLSGDSILTAMENAVATNEVNAAMGVICSSPTAGSSGTLPGVLFSLEKKMNLTDDEEVDFLLCASAFGLIIANNAMIAGALGGCQAEVGSASAMAAAAAVAAKGGSASQSAEAFAFAMSNLLGLVCDPVAGLVEIPCVSRNVVGSVNALAAADMALAGLKSKIPADEVIMAMKDVAKRMPRELRETGLGGLAGTPTGQQIKVKIYGTDL